MVKLLFILIMGMLGGLTQSRGGSVYAETVAPDSPERKIKLNKNTSFKDQVVFPNTTYVVSDFFDLSGESVSIPDGCTLLFRGGGIDNGTLDGHYCMYNKNRFGKNLIYTNFIRFRRSVVYVDDLSNFDTSVFVDGADNRSFDLAGNINAAVEKCLEEYPSVKVVFSGDKTYVFSRTIIVRDNMTIDGNGCVIRFPEMKQGVSMYLYDSFITNRKHNKGGDINTYTSDFYGHRNITVRNIRFEGLTDATPFWFNVNSERGIIALSKVEHVLLDKLSFINATNRIYCVWVNDAIDFCYQNSSVVADESTMGRSSGVSSCWLYGGSYLKDIIIRNNTFVTYADEAIALYNTKHDTEPDRDGVLSNIIVKNNVLKADLGISLGNVSDKICNIDVRDNTFIGVHYRERPVDVAVSIQSDSHWDLSVVNNRFHVETADNGVDFKVFSSNKLLTKPNQLVFSDNICQDPDKIIIADTNLLCFQSIELNNNVDFKYALLCPLKSGKVRMIGNTFCSSSAMSFRSNAEVHFECRNNSFKGLGPEGTNIPLFLKYAQGETIISDNRFENVELTPQNSKPFSVFEKNTFVADIASPDQ